MDETENPGEEIKAMKLETWKEIENLQVEIEILKQVKKELLARHEYKCGCEKKAEVAASKHDAVMG